MSSPELRQRLNIKTLQLRAVMGITANYLRNDQAELTMLHGANKRVAERIKSFAGVSGFSTVLYAMGGGDVTGVIDLMPKKGGVVWSIGERDILDDFELAKTTRGQFLHDPDLAGKLNETRLDMLVYGHYSTDKDKYYFSGGMQLATGLLAAGINPQDVAIVNEYTVGQSTKGNPVQVTALEVKQGDKTFTFNLVSGVELPFREVLEGPDLDVVKRAIDFPKLKRRKGVLALSKASHHSGVWSMKRILSGMTQPFYVAIDDGPKSQEVMAVQEDYPHGFDAIFYPRYKEENQTNDLGRWGYAKFADEQMTIAQCTPAGSRRARS